MYVCPIGIWPDFWLAEHFQLGSLHPHVHAWIQHASLDPADHADHAGDAGDAEVLPPKRDGQM